MGKQTCVHHQRYYGSVIESPIGKISLTATSIALLEINLLEGELCQTHQENKILWQAKIELENYFAGKLSMFKVPLSLSGTTFQISVWEKLRQIPYGTQLSYSVLAKSIGRKGAARAVGSANKKNKLPIIIPCHRVTLSDGTIGGYSAGTEIKRELIELEMRNKLSV